jgi:RimJ/RimL family protein N-acetyltransferase
MKGIKIILTMETERLVIRKFEPNDWKDLCEYLSLKEVLMYEPNSESDNKDCKKLALERSQSDIFFAVCLRETDKMIGHIFFNQLEPSEFLTWEIGYIFNPKFYGNGYATEACKQILKYGFEELGAHRIIGNCNPENTASWKLLERLSMRREGCFKKKAFFRKTSDGKPIWHDSYQYAILEEEWS